MLLTLPDLGADASSDLGTLPRIARLLVWLNNGEDDAGDLRASLELLVRRSGGTLMQAGTPASCLCLTVRYTVVHSSSWHPHLSRWARLNIVRVGAFLQPGHIMTVTAVMQACEAEDGLSHGSPMNGGHGVHATNTPGSPEGAGCLLPAPHTPDAAAAAASVSTPATTEHHADADSPAHAPHTPDAAAGAAVTAHEYAADGDAAVEEPHADTLYAPASAAAATAMADVVPADEGAADGDLPAQAPREADAAAADTAPADECEADEKPVDKIAADKDLPAPSLHATRAAAIGSAAVEECPANENSAVEYPSAHALHAPGAFAAGAALAAASASMPPAVEDPTDEHAHNAAATAAALTAEESADADLASELPTALVGAMADAKPGAAAAAAAVAARAVCASPDTGLTAPPATSEAAGLPARAGAASDAGTSRMMLPFQGAQGAHLPSIRCVCCCCHRTCELPAHMRLATPTICKVSHKARDRE